MKGDDIIMGDTLITIFLYATISFLIEQIWNKYIEDNKQEYKDIEKIIIEAKKVDDRNND